MRLDTRLTEHEETILEKLISVAQDGGDVADKIFELDETQHTDHAAAYDLSVCRSLGELGYIEYSKDGNCESWGSLTSLGYCYFADNERREAEEAARIESEREWQKKIAYRSAVIASAAAIVSSIITAVLTTMLPIAAAMLS